MGQREPRIVACMDRAARSPGRSWPICANAFMPPNWSASGLKAIEWMAEGKRRNWTYENGPGDPAGRRP